ncbi:sigma factor G inhibitor Gin [Ectobacillus antri]|uniref:Sigma factor G inhibitor Gin n=1 Tax=Ectobacillus antri TaxID=2486280 RepID=A0ABT6H6N1_9BACI|nr:sigma factor G inhibitor Gin [Ectobacillus antri]MDG4658003.1 sigma factor G inhibitor Gin [Ectobacillus antri]MDG5755011.1 sigma factor G inhibitor Gin [Ectobacillus antri]
MKSCIVCDLEKPTGIMLYNGFICESCEKDIVCTETNDPKYEFYLTKLRRIHA